MREIADLRVYILYTITLPNAKLCKFQWIEKSKKLRIVRQNGFANRSYSYIDFNWLMNIRTFGHGCFRSLAGIQPPVQLLLLMIAHKPTNIVYHTDKNLFIVYELNGIVLLDWNSQCSFKQLFSFYRLIKKIYGKCIIWKCLCIRSNFTSALFVLLASAEVTMYLQRRVQFYTAEVT